MNQEAIATRDDEPGKRSVEDELLHIAYARLRLSILMSLAVCLIFVGLLWRFFPSESTTTWVVVLLLTACTRYLIWWLHERFASSHRNRAVWRSLFLLGAVAGGFSWALGPVLLMPAAGNVESILLGLTLLSVSAVASTALSPQLPALLGFQVAALAPTALAMYATGGDVERMAGAIIFAGMISLMIAGRAASASTRSLLETDLKLSRAVSETNSARERAEAASQAKSRFLANMSHELRTPLNAVIGAAQLMKGRHEDAEQREYLVDAIERGGTTLLGLIENILDLSRIEAGELTITSDDFNLPECVEAVIATAGVSARAKGLRIACVIDPEVGPWRRGDATRLRQVVLNLLGNAVKFTQAGEIVVRVERGARRDEVRIVVRDTGVGISAASLPFIFEPFRQADDGSARRFSGSGLGLTIVRQLVESMGGTVTVTSELGKGSVFEICMPLVQIADPNPKAPVSRSLEVAYFEPHESSAEALESLLSRCGHRSHRVSNACELRAWCQAHATREQNWWVLVSNDAPDATALLEQVADILDPKRLIGMSSAETHEAELARERVRLPRSLIRPVTRAALVSRMVASEASAASHGLRTAGEPAASTLSARVLVVEDDPTNQIIVVHLLEHAGYVVSAVSDGGSALEAVRANEFDVVLMDWQMPDMDGLEVTRRLRAGESGELGKRVPIVALTANAFAEDRAACVAAGMNDFLTKPVLAATLNATVRRWTQGNQRVARGQGTAPASTQRTGVPTRPASHAPAERPDAPRVFDPTVLAALPMVADGSQPEYAQQVMALFLDSAAGILKTIRCSLAEGDDKTLQRALHTLKSSAASVGALALSGVAREAEAGMRASVAPSPDLLSVLQTEFDSLKEAIAPREVRDLAEMAAT